MYLETVEKGQEEKANIRDNWNKGRDVVHSEVNTKNIVQLTDIWAFFSVNGSMRARHVISL